jgi:hypothetical protein
MFSKLAIVALATFATFATAMPTGGSDGSASCSTGPAQCCQNIGNKDAPGVSALLGLLGVVVSDLGIPIGTGCTPLNIDVGGGVNW